MLCIQRARLQRCKVVVYIRHRGVQDVVLGASGDCGDIGAVRFRCGAICISVFSAPRLSLPALRMTPPDGK